ncbi:MAG: hypothetical protein ACKOXF_08380 [Chitinophagaceae bacterium]
MTIQNEIVDSMKKIDDSTVEVIFKSDAVIGLEEIKNTFNQLHQLTGNNAHKKLIITGRRTEITKDARLFGMEEAKRIGEFVKAEAIVVHSLYQKMVINFYRRFIDSKYPTRFFTDVEKAKEWLNNY